MSEFSGPFEKGDIVRSVTNDHSTARKGRQFRVERVWWTSKGWRFETTHPRFGPISYYCSKFERIRRGALEAAREQYTTVAGGPKMYIAIDVTHTEIKDLRPANFLEDAIGAATSEDLLKTSIRQWLLQFPERKVAIFGLTTLVEVVGEPQIQFRDMRK